MEEIIEEIINVVNSNNNDYDMKDHLKMLLEDYTITKTLN